MLARKTTGPQKATAEARMRLTIAIPSDHAGTLRRCARRLAEGGPIGELIAALADGRIELLDPNDLPSPTPTRR